MLYFDGYCPECLLQHKQVEMQLNTDDFWECPQSGLQIVVSPAVATILRWRGKGQFRQQQQQLPNGLVLAEASKEEGKSIHPDLENIFYSDVSLGWYLNEICDDLASFKQHHFNAKDPVFELQRRHLAALSLTQWQLVFESFRQFSNSGIRFNIRKAAGFRIVEQYLKQHQLIFAFDWQHWHHGWVNLRNVRFQFINTSLLELSMYLSAIFLSEPLDEGTVEFYFNNKTLEKILEAMEAKVMAAV